MEINLTPIVNATVLLLSALITCLVIPWIRQKTTKEQRENLLDAIRIAVYAAEQLYGNGKGLEKKKYVVSYLEAHNMIIDVAQVDAMIEACVLEMNREMV